MSKKTQNNPETLTGKPRKRTHLQSKAIELVKENPTLSNWAIGNKMKDLGLTNNPRVIYELLKYSHKTGREITQIREQNQEMLSREITPLALKIHKKVLQDKSIPNIDKKDWVKMAEVAEFGIDDRKIIRQPAQVNLQAIQQIIINRLNMDSDLETTIIDGELASKED